MAARVEAVRRVKVAPALLRAGTRPRCRRLQDLAVDLAVELAVELAVLVVVLQVLHRQWQWQSRWSASQLGQQLVGQVQPAAVDPVGNSVSGSQGARAAISQPHLLLSALLARRAQVPAAAWALHRTLPASAP